MRQVDQSFGPHQRRTIAARLTDAVAENTGGRRLAGQLQTKFVVEVDDGSTQMRPVEQLFLGVSVGFHRAVVVEMVTRKVGEYRDIDPRPVHPPFLDADRTGLQGTGSGVMGTEVGQIAHQGRRFRRGEAGFGQRIREPGTQRTDDRAGLGINPGQALADGRFAIGTGNRDQRQAFAWVAIDHVRQRPGQRAQGRHAQVRHIEGPDEFAARLPEYGNGALGQGIGNVTTTVGQITRVGQEKIARQNLAAIVGNAGRHHADGRQTVEDFARRAHSLPFPASTAATCTGASGGIPRVRKAPPMICEKAGPATSPP